MSILRLLSRNCTARLCSSPRTPVVSTTFPRDLQKSILREFRRHKVTKATRATKETKVSKDIKATTDANASKISSRALIYPVRYLLYHEGTGRTMFIGCLKVTTIFSFTFFCFIIAPTFLTTDDESYDDTDRYLTAAAVIISGIVPLAFVAYTTAPFVNSVHINLPSYARQSREMLLRYTKSLPANASLQFTGLGIVGRPTQTNVRISELFHQKSRFGIGNYARRAPSGLFSRNGQTLFGVRTDKTRMKDKEVWDNVVKAFPQP